MAYYIIYYYNYINKIYVIAWIISGILILGGIKYNKSTIRNQSIVNEIISSLMGPKSLLMKKKPVNCRDNINIPNIIQAIT